MFLLLAGFLGLSLGSFMNVVIYRLPRGESLSHPGSRCPGCGSDIKPYDNIPVLSWMVLGGHCRSCRKSISARYPAVEALTALLLIGVAVTQHGTRDIALGSILVLTLVPVAFIDIDVHRIPNLLTGLAALAALVAGIATNLSAVPAQLLWAGIAGGFLLIFALLFPRGLGMGDVKLVAVMGLCLERSVLVALLAGLLLAVLFGVGVLVREGVAAGRKTAIPLAPFLAAGGLIGLYAGHYLVNWYLQVH